VPLLVPKVFLTCCLSLLYVVFFVCVCCTLQVIIGGVDPYLERLQGVFLKLLAFQHLLKSCPFNGSVVLVQRTQTSQRRVKDRAQSSREIRALVKAINDEFGPVVDYEEAPRYVRVAVRGLDHGPHGSRVCFLAQLLPCIPCWDVLRMRHPALYTCSRGSCWLRACASCCIISHCVRRFRIRLSSCLSQGVSLFAMEYVYARGLWTSQRGTTGACRRVV